MFDHSEDFENRSFNQGGEQYTSFLTRWYLRDAAVILKV